MLLREGVRTRFDQIAKELGVTALFTCGSPKAQESITSETQYADIWHDPDPDRDAQRAALGLLGRIAATTCLLECFSRAPSAEDVRACINKHLTAWQQRNRRDSSTEDDTGPPFLWIIAAGSPRSLMAPLGVVPALGWPAGVYFVGGDVLRIGLIIASELPTDAATLLVRLMAGGPLIPRAMPEIATLPPDSITRALAVPVLLKWHDVLQREPTRLPEEEEFIMKVYKYWDEARDEGRKEGKVEMLREALELKFGPLVPELERRIANASAAEIRELLRRCMTADSLAAVFA